MRLILSSPSSVPAVYDRAVDHVTNQIVGRGTAAVDVRARGWQHYR